MIQLHTVFNRSLDIYNKWLWWCCAISPVLLHFFYFKELKWKCCNFFFSINSLTFSDFSVWSLLSLWFWVQLSWIFILPSISFFPSLCIAVFFCYWKPSSLSPDFTEDPGKWQQLRLLQSDSAYCLDSLQVAQTGGFHFSFVLGFREHLPK